MIELIAGDGNAAELNVAGDTYNTAAYLKRIAPGLDVEYVTVLGKDPFSDRIVRDMEARGIRATAVARHPGRMPGLYAIETDAAGERSFAYWRSSSAARTLFDADGRDPADVLAGHDLVLLSGISLAILSGAARDRLRDALEGFRANGGLIAFDSNYRPHLWDDLEVARAETERFWRCTDIGLPSVDDEMALFGDADSAEVMARLRSWGISHGALKRGEAGPTDLGPEGHALNVPVAENVLDTTAAGDSFNAGYLAATATGHSAREAMKAGHSLALKVIGKRGAIVDID
ncbi:MAG: sugar kinase [Boseongicola sp. SB0676_bin_33]|uniref:Sugar kinase n=1 Tax=Boseongicola sp. SB0664_bin_43 TaxID=2604844 RepID=A0A6B0Y344_9RHOB|nr:sugar kinase [Boseongicola sp. SB0664_bin_43]MYF88679.1 sugar kinase [Boseongicola sp. SB0676_bin_33]MYK31609.1 sugar kinase [Boseongicola sp. SB0670_bin_30]